MGAFDLLLAASILAAAAWVLHRTFLRHGGGCHGCSQRGSCHAPRQDVVRLGAGKGSPRG